ncbi:hypothetical protein Saso_37620 [Streptomyces asoensis]|uniref:Uncharacterized protein n=1 Tax=Streptomyces asoensis TaxID=249586 RepID=A0ABQ3S1X4_9ACTN|nr:hypothetical protein GCM10010496_42350 [Streptomyces asoensis]GHI62112.1 hypothetical protein Saso_37620 [Streptomyces asoensis]
MRRPAAATGGQVSGQVRESSPECLPPRPRVRPSLVVVSGRRNVRPRMVTMCAEGKCRGLLHKIVKEERIAGYGALWE